VVPAGDGRWRRPATPGSRRSWASRHATRSASVARGNRQMGKLQPSSAEAMPDSEELLRWSWEGEGGACGGDSVLVEGQR
jgi:hypothetical protein